MDARAQTRELVSRNPSEQRCRRHPPTPSTPKSESSAPSATSSKGATRRASLPTRCLLPLPSLASRPCPMLTPDVACRPFPPACVWSRPAEAKDRGQAQNGQGQDRGGLPAALQRTLPLLCFSHHQRHRHRHHHHRLTRLVAKLQEKHRPESLVSQHAKSVNEKKLEKVPDCAHFNPILLLLLLHDG